MVGRISSPSRSHCEFTPPWIAINASVEADRRVTCGSCDSTYANIRSLRVHKKRGRGALKEPCVTAVPPVLPIVADLPKDEVAVVTSSPVISVAVDLPSSEVVVADVAAITPVIPAVGSSQVEAAVVVPAEIPFNCAVAVRMS